MGEKLHKKPPNSALFFLSTTSAEYDRKQKHLFPAALLYCAFLVTHMQTWNQTVRGVLPFFIM